eukprot:COSAG06_NODE_1844_length_8232_cov_8.488872_2_plen_90_part_00
MDQSPDAGTHHIFFDDNIERTYAHIVDCRDAASGEAVPFEISAGLYLVRAEPVLAIQERSYFIDALRACEARREEAAAAEAQAGQEAKQ